MTVAALPTLIDEPTAAERLWTWVQPCAVGAKENGMVHKDYRVVTAAQQ